MRRPALLLKVAIAGGLGGAANAALCYSRLPVPVQESAAKFEWHIVPAGFGHGAALALVAVGAASSTGPLSKALTCLFALAVGWVAGCISGIPLHLSAFGKSLVEALTWPWDRSPLLTSTWIAFPYFGGVGTFVYLWLRSKPSTARAAWLQMLAFSAAATLGSLWWWIVWGPWYFSLLHGSIWGSLVGWAVSHQEGAAAEQ